VKWVVCWLFLLMSKVAVHILIWKPICCQLFLLTCLGECDFIVFLL
jgi:hypothetical protein